MKHTYRYSSGSGGGGGCLGFIVLLIFIALLAFALRFGWELAARVFV